MTFKEEHINDGVMLSKRKSKVKAPEEDADPKDEPIAVENIPQSTEDKIEPMDEEESSENMDVSHQQEPEMRTAKIKRVLLFI